MSKYLKVIASADRKLLEIECNLGSGMAVSAGDVEVSSDIKKLRYRNGKLYVPACTEDLSYEDRICVFMEIGIMERCIKSLRDIAKISSAKYTELWQ